MNFDATILFNFLLNTRQLLSTVGPLHTFVGAVGVVICLQSKDASTVFFRKANMVEHILNHTNSFFNKEIK